MSLEPSSTKWWTIPLRFQANLFNLNIFSTVPGNAVNSYQWKLKLQLSRIVNHQVWSGKHSWGHKRGRIQWKQWWHTKLQEGFHIILETEWINNRPLHLQQEQVWITVKLSALWGWGGRQIRQFQSAARKKHYTDALVFTETLYFQPPDKSKKLSGSSRRTEGNVCFFKVPRKWSTAFSGYFPTLSVCSLLQA